MEMVQEQRLQLKIKFLLGYKSSKRKQKLYEEFLKHGTSINEAKPVWNYKTQI